MFRITEDPSSGSLVQCLAKNYKNGSVPVFLPQSVRPSFTPVQSRLIKTIKTSLRHSKNH
jgi:hypothetical protein